MLKRLTILAFVFSAFLLMNHYSPISEASPVIYKTSQTVSKVAYSEEDGTFYIYTSKASNGHFYVLPIDPAGKSLEQFKATTVGHTIDIYYVIDEAADGDKEVIGTVIQ